MNNALLPALLLLGACGVEDPTLSTTESDLSVTQWQPAVAIPNKASELQPSTVYFKNHLQMAFAGGDGHVWWTHLEGVTWTTATRLDITTSADPRITTFNGALYLAAQVGNDTTVWTSPDGSRWWQVASLDGTRPSIAALGTKLYVGVCKGNRIALDEVVNGTGVEKFSKPGAASNSDEIAYCASTALASFGGKLHLLWTDTYAIFDPGIEWDLQNWARLESTISTIHELVTVPGSSYVVDDDIGMRSAHPAAMSVCNGTVHLIHSGNDNPNELWWAHRSADGSGTWSDDVKISNQSSHGGAGIGCNVYVQPTMVHNTASSNGLVSSIFQ